MGGPRAPAGCFPVHNALPLGWRRTLRKTAFSCDTFFPTVLSSIFSNLPSPIFLLPGEASSRLTDGISCHGEVTASSTRRRVEERDKAASGIDLVPKFPTQPLSIDLKVNIVHGRSMTGAVATGNSALDLAPGPCCG
ncbi:uncharacterized protein LOC127766088 isoform X2 [Oryza glaberrima]|uniref:Uncharacterized protein n=1 Tax=Oryza barthii TaxID=65489 RepID=A0A0D3EZE1_9ORYZ|nr:uncharacterized protein LOC127766088 isoform X2 [Oryza glaberrima]